MNNYYMVILVVDDVNKCSPIFDAWEAIGVRGITILESTGLGRIRAATGYRDDLPLMPSIRNLIQTREEHHRTIFSIVNDESLIDRIAEATQAVLGDLNNPHTGLLFVLPVARVIGLLEPDPNA